VENIVSWPWLGGLLLRGGATYEETGKGRVVVTIDSFTLEGTSPISFTFPLLKIADSTEFVVQDAPRLPESSPPLPPLLRNLMPARAPLG
jgi:hypothetical protein